MLVEFSSTRPPGLPAPADRLWQRSYWPGGAAIAAGLGLLIANSLLLIPDGPATIVAGQVLAVLGFCLFGIAHVARRRAAADARREPRRWTITDNDLRAGNRLGAVRWTWNQVRRVDVRPEVYLLHQSNSPHTATFDVPRDVLTPEQDAVLRAFMIDRGLIEPQGSGC